MLGMSLRLWGSFSDDNLGVNCDTPLIAHFNFICRLDLETVKGEFKVFCNKYDKKCEKCQKYDKTLSLKYEK